MSDDGGAVESTDSGTERNEDSENGEVYPDLWLDQFASYLGFGRLAALIDEELPPSYVYAATTIVGWLAVVVGYGVYTGTPTIYETNPYFLLQPIALLVAVYGSHSLRRSYADVMDEMRIRDRAEKPERLIDIVPKWLPWSLFALTAGVQLLRTFLLDLTSFSATEIVANVFVFPFVYGPILVQFLSIYIAIEFIAPWRLTNSEVGIHFLDPHGVGGLRPLGELIKKAYYYVVFGLVVYALITYAPVLGSPEQEVSAAAGTIFTAVWVLTIATIGFAVLMLHRFMHREKRDEIQRLEDELRSYMVDPWDVTEYTIEDGKEKEAEDIRRRIEQVSSTSEYPATFNIWSQLLLSVAIPKAVQLLLSTL